MSEPLKSTHVRLSEEFYERLTLLAEAERRDVATQARALLEKAICGEWYTFEKKVAKLIKATDAINNNAPSESRAGGFIYVIRIDDLFKIGKSSRPHKRINSMTLPQKPETDCIIKTDDRRATEAELHQRYKPFRQHGEWFRLPAEAVAELQSRAIQ
jgi:predicted DNA-binding protein